MTYNYENKDREMQVTSTPIYPGRVHRSFLSGCYLNKPKPGMVVPNLPDEGPRFQWGDHLELENVSGGDSDDLIHTGDVVKLKMMAIKDYEMKDGKVIPKSFESRGYVAKQKDSTGRFDFSASLGSEIYTDAHNLTAIKWRVELSWPPNSVQDVGN